ncbi:MAG TPA: glycosyltransferase [Pirellulales bacterium]|nr:glycosyltransferase [Pirellulales bacterium]
MATILFRRRESPRTKPAAQVQLISSSSAEPPKIEAKFLRVNGRRFWAKGVTYGSFAANDEGEPFPPFAQLRDDFAQMREAGINTVRLYAPPSDRIADAAADAGLHLIPDICWGPRYCQIDEPEVGKLFSWTREHARRLAGHPAMLMYSIGNEIPPLMVRWYGRARIESFLRTLYEIVKEESPTALVTYANHPPTEHLNLSFLDVVSYNVYLEREGDFRRYLARLQTLAGDRPLFLAELGLDGKRHGAQKQAEFLRWQLQAAFEQGLCGAAVYSWTDEWTIFDERIDGWAFGLTDADRRQKPALQAVQETYQSTHYELRARRWPRVSVVVCSYNGGGTLDECLSSLGRLNYPDCEVIVIDDGSTDDTPEIVRRHACRCLRVENGGLSRARNLGIEAASGEIVAFIDSDAYADPDWLYYLVTKLEQQRAAAVGGPNHSPPQDGFVAQCVDHAPGNPTHVLLDDERAEHVPGCNMAYRKDRLAAVGAFDPTHRAAGDDVDVCWKLLVHGETIAFSPSAIVWHHRRPTIKGYWRQQAGYGYAEAHLKQRYPGRFNVYGDAVWAGSIYDGVHTSLRREGLPALFRPRIYQGRFCGAQFQSVYQPFLTWWFQVFTMAEWQLLAAAVFASSLLAFASSAAIALALLICGVAMAGAALAAAAIPALHAGQAKGWKGRRLWGGRLLVAWLHVIQPWARAQGRIRGWRSARRTEFGFSAEGRIYGNLAQREQWLEALNVHLRDCGWVCEPSSEWGRADLDISGPGPYRLQLCSVYEEILELGAHYVLYRVTARAKPFVWPLAGAVGASLVGLAFAPYLLPLALPLAIVLRYLLSAKRAMVEAVSQLAEECGKPLGMTRVEEARS